MSHCAVILQPSYLPWLGVFDQIDKADSFIFYDTVQYTRRDWRNRNKIKTCQGETCYLTVPVETKGHYHSPICNILIKSSAWREKHLSTLSYHYKKAPFFQEVFSLLQPLLSYPWKRLADLTIHLTQEIAGYLELRPTQFLKSSQLSASSPDSSRRLLELCQEVGATHYLTGLSARNYLQEELFEQEGITVEFQKYRHPKYSQLWGDFIPYLSIVDLMMNEGSKSREILCQEPLVCQHPCN